MRQVSQIPKKRLILVNLLTTPEMDGSDDLRVNAIIDQMNDDNAKNNICWKQDFLIEFKVAAKILEENNLHPEVKINTTVQMLHFFVGFLNTCIILNLLTKFGTIWKRNTWITWWETFYFQKRKVVHWSYKSCIMRFSLHTCACWRELINCIFRIHVMKGRTQLFLICLHHFENHKVKYLSWNWAKHLKV